MLFVSSVALASVVRGNSKCESKDIAAVNTLLMLTIRVHINSNDFGSFLELISRFEFEFRRRGIFF